MNKTRDYGMRIEHKMLITTEELQALLSVGRHSAVKIGEQAYARVEIGRRVLWSAAKIDDYIRELAA